MKARVKATGEIVELYHYGKPYYIEYIDENVGRTFLPEELDLLDDPDYWTRLEHQYAGMAMQGLCMNDFCECVGADDIATDAVAIAHALIQKLKESK